MASRPIRRRYPFARENSLFFAQELLEDVLGNLGESWKAQRSDREKQLRKVAIYSFTPNIGKLVVHQRNDGGPVVNESFVSWQYIMNHRPSVREQMLCNSIVTLCQRRDLETDNKDLYIFLGMAAEHAIFAIKSKQEHLVESVAKAISYCMTDVIPGGFLATLERLQHEAFQYIYSKRCDETPTKDAETRTENSKDTESVSQPDSRKDEQNNGKLLHTANDSPKNDAENLKDDRDVENQFPLIAVKTESEEASVVEAKLQVPVVEAEASKEASGVEPKLQVPAVEAETPKEDDSIEPQLYVSEEKAERPGDDTGVETLLNVPEVERPESGSGVEGELRNLIYRSEVPGCDKAKGMKDER